MTERASVQVEGGDTELLAFRIAGQAFGLPIQAVREVIGRCPIRALPRISAEMSGAVALRGRFLPVVSGRRRLGLGNDDDDAVVLEVEDGNHSFGLAVDMVSGVVRASEAERHELALNQAYRGCADSVFARPDGLLVMLSAATLGAVAG